MAVRGAVPKPAGQKVTRHVPIHDWLLVEKVPYEGPRPKLPRVGIATRLWWGAISTMPHCAMWEPGDWQFALATARIHATFIKDGHGASELRQRERIMGTTADARLSLRIRYVDVRRDIDELEAAEPTVVSMAAYRASIADD